MRNTFLNGGMVWSKDHTEVKVIKYAWQSSSLDFFVDDLEDNLRG
jgi:hypothetical protein